MTQNDVLDVFKVRPGVWLRIDEIASAVRKGHVSLEFLAHTRAVVNRLIRSGKIERFPVQNPARYRLK